MIANGSTGLAVPEPPELSDPQKLAGHTREQAEAIYEQWRQIDVTIRNPTSKYSETVWTLHPEWKPLEGWLSLRSAYDRLCAEVNREWLRKLSSRYADEQLAAGTFREPGPDETPGSLTTSLARPRDPVKYLVEGLLGAKHNLSIEGIFKAGKTSLLAALCGALADDRPFLGFASVSAPAGVGVWNLEMDADDFDGYLAAEVVKTDKVWIAHLRGRPVPFLGSKAGRDWAVKWLKGCPVWIIDTWSRLCAWNGIDPLDNAGVARLTSAVDEIKAEAGVGAVVVTTHMPHSARTTPENERAFGAQAFSGWVDAMWRYVRDENDFRYLSADGRKVRLPECQVVQGLDGRLTARQGDRKAVGQELLSDRVLMFVQANPGSSTNAVEKAVGGRAASVVSALHAHEKQRAVYSQEGKNRSIKWFPAGQPGQSWS